MKDKKILKNIEMIRFTLNNIPYVLLYNTKTNTYEEALAELQRKNFNAPNLCIMKEIQFRNVFSNGEY